MDQRVAPQRLQEILWWKPPLLLGIHPQLLKGLKVVGGRAGPKDSGARTVGVVVWSTWLPVCPSHRPSFVLGSTLCASPSLLTMSLAGIPWGRIGHRMSSFSTLIHPRGDPAIDNPNSQLRVGCKMEGRNQLLAVL